jgi:hypothetical protein
MKTKRNILLSLGFILIAAVSYAQGPPEPPEDPNTGGGPVGGNAPIGSGIAILLTLGAAYGGHKVYQYWQSQKEELEE